MTCHSGFNLRLWQHSKRGCFSVRRLHHMKVLPQAILSYLSNLDARCVPDIGGTQACWCRGGHVLGSAIRSCVLSLLPSDSRAFHTAYAQSGRARPTASMKERVGAALSLDKFARAKVSKYDKRKVIEKQRTLKAKQISKYKKLKQRLGSAGAPLDVSKGPLPACDSCI